VNWFGCLDEESCPNLRRLLLDTLEPLIRIIQCPALPGWQRLSFQESGRQVEEEDLSLGIQLTVIFLISLFQLQNLSN
jgi:hypothetical protein